MFIIPNVMHLEIYKVAIYVRLSKEDEKTLESESIVNQKDMLLKYVKENNLSLYDVYIDDGYTGTNFNRPAFIKMIEDINKGFVNMVVVKDLSRFGRDYIETGEYIEKWFPKNNVRFVAILDNVDTIKASSSNEFAPFKALFNDMYSKDNSKKIRAALRSKQESGLWVGGCTPFGYKTLTSNKNKLVINEEESIIVKRIFSLFLEGKTRNQIINILHSEKVLTPSQMRNNKKESKYASLGYWNVVTVKGILTNELYTGNLVQNRRSKISYKIKKINKNKKEDYIIVKNTHEAIISEQDFEKVQKLLVTNKSIRYNKIERSKIDNLLYCKECGHKLAVIESKKGKDTNRYYTICNSYKKYSKIGICTSHSNNLMKLEEVILKEVKNILKSYIDVDISTRNLINNKSNIKYEENKLLLKKYIYEKEKLEKQLDSMYIDKLSEKIDGAMYDRLSIKIKEDISILNTKIENMKSITIKKENTYSVSKLNEIINNYLSLENDNIDLLNKLISKIDVSQDKNIDIYFNFNL